MKKLILVAMVLALVAGTAGSARADTFTFTVSGPTATGWGILDGSSIGAGVFGITSGSLTITAAGAGVPAGWIGNYLLVPNPALPATSVSPMGLFYFDDVLSSGQPHLGSAGVLFTPTGGASSPEINIWGNGPGNLYSFWFGAAGGYPNHDDSTEFSATAANVPEPATLSLLGLGLVGIARAARRKKA